MILLLPVVFQTHLTQHQEDHKHLHQHSVVERLDQVHLILQAINLQARQVAPTILLQLKVVPTIPLQLQQEVLRDTNRRVHRNSQALKDHTQVLELQSLLQTCHLHHTNPLKDSCHNLTLPTQLQELRKRQPENIYRQDEDKTMHTVISTLTLQVIPITNISNK